ncbi:MAG TPA: UbiA family prenyltransferase, partial [Kofleriaceae bacterium]|nr:UbiA family prenyltransferase [Kofleriaceae bacterium]
MRALIEACRPRQWVKNAIVAAPLVFAKQLTDPHTTLRALAAVALFCALSSAVYLWNDVIDVERDRAHPIKRNRPIASGRLSIGMARVTSATL